MSSWGLGTRRWFLVGMFLLTSCGHVREGSAPRQIRSPTRVERRVPGQIGASVAARPLAPSLVPVHPYMAQHGASCMHVDPYTTNTYAWAGPLGQAPEVQSRSMGFLGGECPTVNFDSQGRIVTVCVQGRKPRLVLLDPNTLEVLSSYALPRRRVPLLRMRKAVLDTSGGVYFYLDHKDRAVVGSADGDIDIVAVRTNSIARPALVLVERIPVQSALRLANGELDRITSVMPDYEGNYWFAGRYGTLGVVDARRSVKSIRFAGEEIQNSFSVAREGVYVVTDHALYRLERDHHGKPSIVFREPYDRGRQRKIGQVNQGSGTTPTLLGDRYVAIADNAEPRMNVLVYRRARAASTRRVCEVPVFEPGQSATENTLIGHGNSLIVENNAGYDIFRTMRRGKTSAPGIARVDVRADESGCDLVWTSDEISQTAVPKLSAATGLVYLYTKMPNAPERTDAYYFTALDFATGRTAYRVLTGTGVRYDNHWAAISIAKDGTAFIGVLNGIVRVRDRPNASSALSLATR